MTAFRTSRVKLSPRFEKSFSKLDGRIRELAKKSLGTLIRDPDSRSLHLEPIQGRSGFWTIRVNDNFRILLRQEEDAEGRYFLAVEVANHDLYKKG